MRGDRRHAYFEGPYLSSRIEIEKSAMSVSSLFSHILRNKRPFWSYFYVGVGKWDLPWASKFSFLTKMRRRDIGLIMLVSERMLNDVIYVWPNFQIDWPIRSREIADFVYTGIYRDFYTYENF